MPTVVSGSGIGEEEGGGGRGLVKMRFFLCLKGRDRDGETVRAGDEADTNGIGFVLVTPCAAMVY